VTTEYVETRMVMIDELTPFPGNARRGDPHKLAESLEANGQYRSLIVRQAPDGLIVLAGNNTLLALEAKGELEARCEIVQCDDATALRVNLVDNKTNDSATYDDAARAALLVLLDGELAGTGYDDDEADTIIARFEEEEITPLSEPAVLDYNDDQAEREARILSHGGHESRTMESRGIRDVILAMPAAEADELGRLIMALRATWGALPQGDILLRAARCAWSAMQDEIGAVLNEAETPYAPEEGS
jgi:ParB-like chromosome segregation protein Spo0J